MKKLSLAGSCLCGSVAYEISGDAVAFNHCHCQRCRKSTGTGHASNILLKSESVTWLAGEELLARYDVPEAERFAAVFCRNCGSPMPRVSPDRKLVVVPAGSLDADPDIRPERRIFGASRTAWSCVDGELPVFDRYPPKG